MRRDPYNDPYGPYGAQGPYGNQGPYGGQGPYGPYGGYGGYRGYRYRRPMGGGGGGCARDACLLESGCCLAESLGGNCLVLAVALSGRLTASLLAPRRRSGSARELVVDAIHRYRADVSSKREVPCCRFTPSCSSYAEEAVARHGAVRGSWLAVRRLVRCRPGGRRGFDPVPD